MQITANHTGYIFHLGTAFFRMQLALIFFLYHWTGAGQSSGFIKHDGIRLGNGF